MDDVLAGVTGAPEAPDGDTCEVLLDELARLIVAGGWQRFARSPVVPGDDAFPDPWERTPRGVATVARRLIAHAGVDDVRVVVADRRGDAGSTAKVTPTELELVSNDPRARF